MLCSVVCSADADTQLRQLLQQELSAGGTVSASAKQLAKQLKIPRSRIYKLALEVEAGLQQQQQEKVQLLSDH
jgi:hypothetical protein